MSVRLLDVQAGAAAAATPLSLPSSTNTPPIFFSPTSSSSNLNIISPSPSPSVYPLPDSPIPEAALVGTGVAGAVVATALISTIASKMGCSLLGPLFSLLSFIFKKLLGIQRCAQIIRLPRLNRSTKKGASSSRSFDYGRADSNASLSASRHYSSSPHSRNDVRRHRDDVAIEVCEELEVTRKRLNQQVNDVGYMLRPTNSNISKFAAAEMRKLGGGINIHDTRLVINQNVHEGHDHIRTVNVSLEELEVGVDQRVTSNMYVDCRSSAAAVMEINGHISAPEAEQIHGKMSEENTRRLQLAEMSNEGTDGANQIDNHSHSHNTPSTSRRHAADLHPNETAVHLAADAAPPVRFNTDGTLMETRREPLNARTKIMAPGTATVSGGTPEYAYARYPPNYDLQIIPSSRYGTGTGTGSRSRRSADDGTNKKAPRTRRPSKKRRLSKVAGVRVSCELSAHFMKFFVFCKTGTNYGADTKKDVDNADSSRPHDSVSDADGTLEKQPYSVHLPSMQSSAIEVPPTFPPIQFYQPSSLWQTYPPPPTIISSGSGVGTAAAAYRMRSPSHIHGRYASEAARSSMASTADSSVAQTTAFVQVPPEAGIRQQYSPSYQLVPIVNPTAGSYIIDGGGGNYATVAMMAAAPVPPAAHHNVTISEATATSSQVANSSTRNSETNSMADDAEDLQEPSTTTCNHHEEKTKSNIILGRTVYSSSSSGHESRNAKLGREEMGGNFLYGV